MWDWRGRTHRPRETSHIKKKTPDSWLWCPDESKVQLTLLGVVTVFFMQQALIWLSSPFLLCCYYLGLENCVSLFLYKAPPILVLAVLFVCLRQCLMYPRLAPILVCRSGWHWTPDPLPPFLKLWVQVCITMPELVLAVTLTMAAPDYVEWGKVSMLYLHFCFGEMFS